MSPRTTSASAIAILALSLPSAPAAAPRVSVPAVTLAVTFNPVVDARVESANPTTNYGAAELRVRSGTTVNSYLKFSVTGLLAPIDSARVRLYCNNDSPDGGSIHIVANDFLGTSTPWTESALNWTNAPAISGPALDQAGPVLVNTWVEFDVTSAFQGDSMFSFALTSTSTNIAGYHSREGANPPQLVIELRIPPGVGGFAPASGAAGTEVTVTGSGFLGVLAVAFNGAPASSFTIDSDVQIRAVVPAGAKSGPISVTNAWGTTVTVGDFVIVPTVPEWTFAALHDARVESANPATNYGSNPLLRVRSAPAVNTYLKFEVAGLTSSVASAKVRLFCNNESGDGGRIHAVANDYAATSTPWTESGLNWNNAPSLSGAALDQAGAVSLNTWIEFDVTAALTANGTHSFGLASDLADIAGYSSKEGARPPELVIQQRPPAILSFAPATAPVGSKVTVTGTDLSGVISVEIDSRAAAFTIDSDTQLRATVPAGAFAGPIRITGAAGVAVSTENFVVLLPPTLNGFSPTGGPAGTIVTITGTSLGHVTTVDFYGTAAEFVVDGPIQLRATVPAGAQSGRIHLANAAGAATSGASFAVLLPPVPVPGLWTSAAELASKPMSGMAWEQLLAAADTADRGLATVSEQNSDHNIATLAAAIVYARTGITYYRDVVARACDSLVAGGKPPLRSLPWARETGAYALAADLVGYRNTAFEFWLRNMAEVWEGEDDRYLLEALRERPNNWGAHAFGSLAAIYGYLGDSFRLAEIRDYWIQSVVGPNPGQVYAADLTWHMDPANPRTINPHGGLLGGLNVDGLIPDDMQRGGPFQVPPEHTHYPWEHMQGLVMAARILERRGVPIWSVGDDAIFRAAYAMQVRLESQFGGWKADADDLWMLPFLDAAYGTNWSASVDDDRLWQAGKNTGWAYVVWEPELLDAGKPVENESSIELRPVVPSPVRESGVVEFQLARSEVVGLRVFDVGGRMVQVLAQGPYEAGRHRVTFAARGLASGMYLIQLDAGGTTRAGKLTVIR